MRKCCQKTAVCYKCFSFMTVAVKVLDDLLRTDFGFKHLLWVFSGRRGIHCWVCDPVARAMTNVQRASVADYLSIAQGKDEALALSTPVRGQAQLGNRGYERDKASQFSALHPSLDRVYNKHMLPCFERLIVEDQVRFDDAAVQQLLLKDVPPDVCEALRDEWAKDTTASHKWKIFKATMVTCFEQERIRKCNPVLDVVFRYVYPRLDINVSKSLNHLLKSPFVVHPSTGNVCVPINPKTIESFDLARVPKLSSIMAQLDAGTTTDMDTAVADFRKLFLDPLDASIRAERIAQRQREEGLSF